MEMRRVSKKKRHYPIREDLLRYLDRYGRCADLPVYYEDLLHFNASFPFYDKDDKDTLWETVVYDPSAVRRLNHDLTMIYSLLKTAGDTSVIDHLYVDRIDFCTFGNSCPFRVRIVNQFNDNYDYFYVKKADASRVYGLELEELLSPNSMNYLVSEGTLIEEHIAGIPGDDFIRIHFNRPSMNKVRMAKEFVKFNERIFIRLLGDMRAYNYIVDITPDFEDEQYRVRAFDFDQQSYEGSRTVYMPQFFKDNYPVVQLCTELLNLETIKQYQNEERTLIARRMNVAPQRFDDLRHNMCRDTLSLPGKLEQLKKGLAAYHHTDEFLKCKSMGEVVFTNVEVMLRRIQRPKYSSS